MSLISQCLDNNSQIQTKYYSEEIFYCIKFAPLKFAELNVAQISRQLVTIIGHVLDLSSSGQATRTAGGGILVVRRINMV